VTKAEVIRIIEQRIGQAIGQIGCDSPGYLDEFLLEYVKTSNFLLESLGAETGVTVDPAAETITPDPSDVIGLLLAYQSAATLIGDDLITRLKSGELGLSFSTGVTDISTNQAAITLRTSANKLISDYELLLTAYFAGDPNTVVERLT
jgi:hypothetical protein